MVKDKPAGICRTEGDTHMKTMLERGAGILMPVSSLPSPYGIGTFGSAAYEFVDFLKKARQKYWQVLPVGPTSYGDSPYQSFSAFAGNPYFIDLDTLVKEGLLTQDEINACYWGDNPTQVAYDAVFWYRFPLLKKAYARSEYREEQGYEKFCMDSWYWMNDYAFYMALKFHFDNKEWLAWPEDIRFRKKEAVESYREELKDEIDFWKFLQYKFYQQWGKLRTYANEQGISIIGDIPIYVALDSADVWTHPELFLLDEENLTPLKVAGVPPDAFSETGQLWGNPLYKWDYHKSTGYAWWLLRLAHVFKLYDTVRIDHFRGFDEYYSIPYGDQTAEFGHWEKGPGMDIFRTVKETLGDVKIIAEDLGFLTDSVIRMVEESGYPGMKVLEFAFDSREPSNYLPHNYDKNCVVYTGTHDNETLAGWYRELKKEDKKFALRYMGRKKLSVNEAVWEIIRLAQSSVADTCIIPIQDYLCLGNEARINHPSTLGGNWIWRLHRDEISKKLVKKIRRMTELYCRIPEKTEMLLKAEDAEDLGEEKK